MKAPKKIIMLSVDFPPLTGGISQLLHNIAVGFTRKGYDVLAVAPRYRGFDFQDNELPYKVRRIPFIRGFFEGMAFLAILREWLKTKDMVVVCGTWVAGGLPLMLMNMITGLNYFMVVYGMDILQSPLTAGRWTKGLRALYMKKSFKRARQIWAISEYTKKVVESYLIEPGKINVFPLPLREDFEQVARGERRIESEAHPGKVILMTIGKLVSYKGQDKVIQVLPRLRERFGEVEYHIVGGGPEKEYLEKLVAKKGMEKYVVFYGSVSNDRLPELYALCDVFIMASREDLEAGFLEGFGLVYLEANALGKPVVGGRSGGVPSAVEHGVSGLLVEPEDLDDIFDKISSLLADAEYAKKLGEQGRDRVLNHFLVEHMMQTLEDFLKQAATIEESTRG